VLNEAMSATAGGKLLGKKTVGNTSAEAVPYKKKSYHSTLVPARPVNASLVIDRPGSKFGASCVAMVSSRRIAWCVAVLHTQMPPLYRYCGDRSDPMNRLTGNLQDVRYRPVDDH
jgi:hypothetical protein